MIEIDDCGFGYGSYSNDGRDSGYGDGYDDDGYYGGGSDGDGHGGYGDSNDYSRSVPSLTPEAPTK